MPTGPSSISYMEGGLVPFGGAVLRAGLAADGAVREDAALGASGMSRSSFTAAALRVTMPIGR